MLPSVIDVACASDAQPEAQAAGEVHVPEARPQEQLVRYIYNGKEEWSIERQCKWLMYHICCAALLLRSAAVHVPCMQLHIRTASGFYSSFQCQCHSRGLGILRICTEDLCRFVGLAFLVVNVNWVLVIIPSELSAHAKINQSLSKAPRNVRDRR